MILININERQCYIYKEGFAEDIMNDMFEEYFSELYQENAVKWRVCEINEKISLQIPKQSIFVEKDSVLYSVNDSLEFTAVPNELFQIDEITHPVLMGCFEKCYSNFKNLMENYRNWDTVENSSDQNSDFIANVFLKTVSRYTAEVESLSTTLKEAGYKFNSILRTSLKAKMSEKICTKIVELYKNTILQNNPIMLISKKDGYVKKIYAVTDNLEVEEVEYSLIERELEEIIHEVIPEDTDFLVNMIYNFMIAPLIEVKPCVRINKIQDAGINATIFLEKNDIPVVCDFNMKYFYAFLKGKRNGGFPTTRQIRYHNELIDSESMDPKKGMEIFRKFNPIMFDEMSCYVENTDEKYQSYEYSGYTRYTGNTVYSILYRIKKGVLEPVYNQIEIKERTEEYKKFEALMKKEGEKANKQGCYAFWTITIKDKK